MRACSLVVLVVGGFVLAACGSGGDAKSQATDTAASTVSGASQAPPITGFGAANADWDGAHTEDQDFAPGAAYDADTALPKVNGHEGTHYAAVDHEAGRVLDYYYMFANRSIASAKSGVLRTQFPGDVKVVWFVVKPTCGQMLVKSATLAKALDSKAIGDSDGSALIEFGGGANGNSYNPKAINYALVGLSPLEPKNQSPGC